MNFRFPVLCLVLTCLLTGAARAQDTEAPTIVGEPVVTPNAVDLSSGPDTVMISLVAQDPGSGVANVIGFLQSSEGGFAGTFLASRISGTPQNGTWEASGEVPLSADDGVYDLVVLISDAVNNFAQQTFESVLTVSGSDMSPPELVGTPTFEPASINFPGEQKTVTATFVLSDEGSGIEDVTAYLKNIENQVVAFGQSELIDGDANFGTWTSKFEIYPDFLSIFVPSGDLFLSLNAHDKAFNFAEFDSTAELQVIRSKSVVTFSVDMRRLERLGLFRRPQFLQPGMRLYVDVGDGVEAGSYQLFDYEGDSVWTALVLLTPAENLTYSFAIDPNSDGVNLGDWIYERPGNPRSLDVSGAMELPTVPFDDMPAGADDLRFTARATRAFVAGASGPVPFEDEGSETLVSLSFDALEGPALVSIRRIATNPGGAGPAGIAAVSSAQLWIVDAVPSSSSPGDLILDYSDMGGISDPAALRLLRRTGPGAPWQVASTSVSIGEETLSASFDDFVGEWTIGTTSAANILAPRLPGMASQPQPGDGAVNVPIDQSLAWTPGEFAQSYDVYLWRDGSFEPTEPTSRNLTGPILPSTELFLFRSRTYRWFVVARNLDGETRGPTWTFTTQPPSDLQISDVLAPSEGFSGREIDLAWTVTNVGTTPTTAPVWFDFVRLSSDPSFLTDVRTLGAFENPSALLPGEQYVQNATVRLPDDAVGTRYLRIEANYGRSQEEETFTNNDALSAIDVTLTPSPDLRVSAIVSPANAFSGREVEVSWTVENAGQGAASAQFGWMDDLHLSESPVFDETTAIFLGWSRRTDVLGVGDTYTVSRRVVIPARISGDYYFIVTTDRTGTVYEHGAEANNSRTSDAVAVTLSPPADLSPSTFAAPPAATAGESIDVSWEVGNQGPGAVESGAWQDRILLSGGDIDEPITLKNLRRSGALGVDTSYTGSASVRLPDGLGGEHILIFETDWADAVFEHDFEDNNRIERVINLTRPPYPDLAVQNIEISGTPEAGRALEVRWRVRNLGTAALNGGWTDRVYLSARAEFDTTAIPLAAVPANELLAPTAVYTRASTVRIPAGSDGALRLFVIADADEAVFEYPDDVQNNVGSAAIDVAPYPPVDLAVADVTAPAAALGGAEITVTWTVTNLSETPPPVPVWDDVVYLSADQRVDPQADPVLARVRRTEGLQGKQSYQRQVTVRLPNGISGPFNILVKTEAPDSDDSNNVGSPNNPVAVTIGPTPNLVSIDTDASPTGVGGQPFQLSWTVRNDGDATAGPKWFDAVYLSADQTVNLGDLRLGGVERTTPLSPGSEYQHDLEIMLPFFASGKYYLLISLDDRNAVFEGTGDFDNVIAHPLEITLPPPSDLVVTEVVVPASAAPGDEVTVSWTIQNQGEHRAQGVLRDAVYISQDAEWQLSDPLLGSELRLIDLAPGASLSQAGKFDLARTYLADAEGNVTGQLPGVAPGSYHAIVRVDIRNNIRESDETNNVGVSTGLMKTDIALLPLGGSVTGDLAPRESRFYKIELPRGVETFELTLESSSDNASNELHVSAGRVPGLADSDVKHQDPFGSSFTLSVPRQTTEDSTYYVLLYQREGSSEGLTYTLSAEEALFELDQIDLAEGGQGGRVTVKMTGSSFGPRTRALLENGEDRIPATVVRKDGVEAYATFDLADAPLGTYDFVAARDQSYISLDSDSIRIDTNIIRSILPGAFRVVPMISAEPVFEVKVPEALRVEQEFVVSLEVTNRGNTDHASPLVVFWTNPATRSTLHVDEDETEGYKRILMTGPAPLAGVLRPGATHRVLVNVTAPEVGPVLEVFAGPVVGSGAPFNFDLELREALLDSEDLSWGNAVAELRVELATTGWAGYERRLAETASRLSRSGVVQHDAIRLLLQLLVDVNQNQVSPPFVGDAVPASSGKGAGAAETMNPCDHFGPIPNVSQGPDCSTGQIAIDVATLSCVAAGIVAPQICGGVHGAAHLAHFLAGDGSTIVYDDNSWVAEKIRGHDEAYKSYGDIHKQTTESIGNELTDRIREAGCNVSVSPGGDISDLGVDVPNPNMYDHEASKGIPYYDPFNDGLPSELTVEQPGCDLVTAFGGFQSAEGRMSNFRTRSLPEPPSDDCVPGCTIVWEADLTYEFGDLYEFDEADKGAYDDRGRNLQLCGVAKPFDTKVIMKERIGGIVRVPPKQRKCKRPPPPELPPFLFLPPQIIPVLTSQDPNDIVGPAGYGDKRWVAVSAQLPYKIRFENDPELATAPA
ncbi:MAG TPA: CARDB domain-containing protein, partial [Rhodothermales bacterium]|nr:CARDB domain-containing protein [Rhodothermales bacterium]